MSDFEDVLGFAGLGLEIYGEQNVIAHKLLEVFKKWIEHQAAGEYGPIDLEVVGISFDDGGFFRVLVTDSLCEKPYCLVLHLDSEFQVEKAGYNSFPNFMSCDYAEVSNWLRIDSLPVRELVMLAKGDVKRLRPVLGYFPGEEDIERAKQILEKRFNRTADELLATGPARILINESGGWAWVLLHPLQQWAGHGVLVN